LEELSVQYSISRERVRQIEVRAFEKLQKAMRAQIIDRKLHVCLEANNQKLCLIKAAHDSNKSSGDCLWSSNRAIGGAPD
jgi:Sigma-70, region 4